MRVLGLALTAVIGLAAPIAAHAAALGSNLGSVKASTAPRIAQVWGGCGWGWHPVPGHWSQWRGEWVPPHCAPNDYGGWGGPQSGWGGGPYQGSGGYPGGQARPWIGPYGNNWGRP